jgi:hypothetical protein
VSAGDVVDAVNGLDWFYPSATMGPRRDRIATPVATYLAPNTRIEDVKGAHPPVDLRERTN